MEAHKVHKVSSLRTLAWYPGTYIDTKIEMGLVKKEGRKEEQKKEEREGGGTRKIMKEAVC